MTRKSGSGRSRRECQRRPWAQAGVTLVETLVTLVSTSVGLLAIASLHLLTTSNYQDASQRLRATALASAMLERIRADEAVFHQHGYDINFDAAADTSTDSGQRIKDWRASVREALSPDHILATQTAIITNPATSHVTIVIRWSRIRHEANQSTSFRQVVLESAI